jgi:hypothetical protein
MIESREHVCEIEVRPRSVIDDIRRRFTRNGVLKRGNVANVARGYPPTLAARTPELNRGPDCTQRPEREHDEQGARECEPDDCA